MEKKHPSLQKKKSLVEVDRPEQIEPGSARSKLVRFWVLPTSLSGQGLGIDPAAQKTFSWRKPGLKYLFWLFYTIKYVDGPLRPSPKKEGRLAQ